MYLSGFDNSTSSQVKSHAASEIEALSQVDPRRYVKKRAASAVQMLNPIYRRTKRLGVDRDAVADAPEIRYGNPIVTVLHRHYAGAGDRLRRRGGVAEAEEDGEEEAEGWHFGNLECFGGWKSERPERKS